MLAGPNQPCISHGKAFRKANIVITAYGPIMVCGNYQGDLKQIAARLNQWLFASGAKFCVHAGRIIGDVGEYPSTVPRDDDFEPIDLETISQRISPLLIRGTLELVALAHEELDCAWLERLIIRPDGCVEQYSYTFVSNAVADWNRCATAKYDPQLSLFPELTP